jgi:hypothetical protein
VVQVPGSIIVVKFDENDGEMTVFLKIVGFIVLLLECPMTTTVSEKSY